MILRLGGPHGRLAASGEFFKDHRMDPSERSPRSLRSLGANFQGPPTRSVVLENLAGGGRVEHQVQRAFAGSRAVGGMRSWPLGEGRTERAFHYLGFEAANGGVCELIHIEVV